MKNFFLKLFLVFLNKALYPFLDLVETFPPFFTILTLGIVGIMVAVSLVLVLTVIVVGMTAIFPFAVPIFISLALAFALGWFLKILLIDYYDRD